MTCGDTSKGHPGVLSQMVADRSEDMKVGRIVNVPKDKASHFSEDKSGVDQIPVEILMEWGQVFTMGQKKYGRDNWKSGTDWHEFYGSALRHMFAFWNGEDNDPESGLSHLAHALWNIAAIRYYQLHELGDDSRDMPDDAGCCGPAEGFGTIEAIAGNTPHVGCGPGCAND